MCQFTYGAARLQIGGRQRSPIGQSPADDAHRPVGSVLGQVRQ